MADSRRYLEQILEEAQNRWLRPSEICEILRNYQKFCLAPDPPYKPPGGSLFLFDRKTLRYFRKDGHCWRKKKDGKTVREAHEKLKAGSVDVLHCYYAHGEDNENFQRRSYWMLDGKLEHIVLVHYREVKEGSRSGVPRLLNADPGAPNQNSSCLTSLAPSSYAQASSPALAGQAYASSPSTGEWNGQTPSSEFEDADSGDDIDASPMMEPSSGFRVASLFPSNPANENTLAFNCGSCNPYYPNQVGTLNLTASENLQTEYDASQEAGSLGGDTFGFSASSSNWSESSNRNMSNLHEQKVGPNPMTKGVTDLVSYSVEKESIHTEYEAFPEAHLQILLGNTRRSVHANPKMERVEHVDFLPSDDSLMNESSQIYEIPQEHNFNLMNEPQENYYGSPMNVADNAQSLELSTENCRVEKHALKSLYNEEQQGDLKKLDSFGRWMSKEIGRDSLIASESPSYWHSLDTDNNKLSSLSHHMQLDIDSLGPSLSQEQLFSIDDFSPDWAYSDDKTKVLIFGTFLGGLKQHPNNLKWCCMFGEVEVSAEVLTANSLRCQAPAHAPGRVPFYITCSDRLACSEVRDFEYREKPSGSSLSTSIKIEPEEEMRLQIRLTKMLVIGVDKRQWMACSVVNCEKCNLKANISFRNEENEWVNIEKASQENTREALLQKLLKDRLYEWLVCKVHEEGKGPNVLDEEGQGVIHLTSALGYEWAIVPIVAAGVSPSFRDARGRTGLHWAAYYGREETVVTLVRLGAAPGAVEDPTSKFPEGRTAADLASSRGHKGIAGYLAEEDLTSHLSYLTLKQSVLDNVPGTFAAAEETVESIEEQNLSPLEGRKEDRSSLRGSLAAVRNSAQAAARIQAAFRVHSFIQRQSARTNDENSEISSEVIVLASLSNKTQKVGHFSDSLHAAAAIRIQQKYRGWKGRKEFLKIRNRIVKIQAHVRGHQVRKQYKKVVWSVGIVEKAILRWRRKGTGLRGFRVDKAITNVGPEVGKTDEYDFLRMGRKQKKAGVEKALARVQSMVRYPEARDQYMRLVQKSKARDEGSASGDAPSS